MGGKIKTDGFEKEASWQYNGFAIGYDHEVGNNWRIGLAGEYAKGDVASHISADGRTNDLEDTIGGTAFEYGIGVNHKMSDNSSLYIDVERIDGGEVDKNWGVNVGFRYSF